ncbi:LAME_0A01398g1_1 [Lachancea meyersii CBS 8951]|uniref:LAME_0A01398g1_1 n=1 Tax=Lachancea meyersii CBS 8951 TaxID=1266667 RepID=A0A1G4ILP6_9SACH|nr:LAME_0A01398g1_1 [Lachancea meyersii CBS 8951]
MSLNRTQREKFVSTHISHKYNLLHILPGIEQTQLAGLYLKSFYNGVKRNRLHLPEPLINGTKFCEKCGLVHIAGVNLEMEIVEKSAENNENKSRILQYRCKSCGEVKEFQCENSKSAEREAQNATSGFVAKWPSATDAASHTTTNSKVKKLPSAKERAKKRKMSSLLSMLNKKKEANSTKKSLSLSLEDFLQKN